MGEVLSFGFNLAVSLPSDNRGCHWRLEALLGVGYARLWYDERLGLPCRKCVARRSDNYVGPTRIALTVSCLF